MGVTDPVAVGAAGEADGAATGAGGGGGGVGGASGSSKPQSALEENIVRKGKNSYYYAHASNLARDVDADAGKLLHASTDHAHAIGAPRLLHRGSVEELAEDAAARRRVRLAPVERYSWADFKKSVKVYGEGAPPRAASAPWMATPLRAASRSSRNSDTLPPLSSARRGRVASGGGR